MTAAVHLSLAGRPGPSPHTRIVSGPNVKIAMLRALAQRAAATAPIVWQWVKRGAALVAKTPGWVGHAVLGVLSTPSGYASAVQLVGTGVKAGWRLLDRAACLAGRGIATVTGLAASTIRHIAPSWGQALIAAHADAVDAVNALHEHVVQRVNDLGQRLEQLALTPPVKTTTTRAAAAASALLVLHVITKGLLASKVLELAPSLAGLVVAATSPWWLLLAVMGITVGTITGVAYTSTDRNVPLDDLVVNIDSHGNITVIGVPKNMSATEQQRVTSEAANLVLKQLGYSIERRPANKRRRPPRTGTINSASTNS